MEGGRELELDRGWRWSSVLESRGRMLTRAAGGCFAVSSHREGQGWASWGPAGSSLLCSNWQEDRISPKFHALCLCQFLN